jgi:hypothetical protein
VGSDNVDAAADAAPDSGSEITGQARTQGGVQSGTHANGQAQFHGGQSTTGKGDVDAGAKPKAAVTTPAAQEEASSTGKTGSAADGDAGELTHVSLATHEDQRGDVRATAKVKASAGLQAALRQEARIAAREEARAELRAPGFQNAAAASAAQSAQLMQLFRAAWLSGGAARVAALGEICFGEQSSGRPVPPELAAFLASIEHRSSGENQAEESEHAGESESHVGVSEHAGAEQQGEAESESHVGVSEHAGAEQQGEAQNEVETPTQVDVQSTAQGQTQTGGNGGVQSPTAPTVQPSTPTSGTAPVTTTAPVTQHTAPSGGEGPDEHNASPSPSSSVAPTQFASMQRATQGSGAQSGQLPFTGGDVPLIVMLGGAALGAGALLLRRSRSGAR